MIQGRAKSQHYGLPTGGATSPVPDGRVGPDEVVRVQGDHLFLSGSCRRAAGVASARRGRRRLAVMTCRRQYLSARSELVDRWVSLTGLRPSPTSRAVVGLGRRAPVGRRP